MAPPKGVLQLVVVQRKQPGSVLIVHVDPNGSDPEFHEVFFVCFCSLLWDLLFES